MTLLPLVSVGFLHKALFCECWQLAGSTAAPFPAGQAQPVSGYAWLKLSVPGQRCRGRRGQGIRTTRVTTRMVTSTGFDPLPVFPHGMRLPHRLAGLALR